MNRIRLNPKALEDLKGIKAYISEELDNPSAAKKILSGIIESYERLIDFPFMGRDLSSKINIKTDYRYLVCDKYIVFYKYDEQYISIYRVLYSKRDYLNILFMDENELN